jgi:4-nitrophenyl phosphatase
MRNGTQYNIDALIIDMDGVLWRDTAPIGNLERVFHLINDMGLKITLATNNSTKTVAEYLNKLAGYGVSLQPNQIITSSEAAASYLISNHPPASRVYVVGEPALEQVLSENGFIITAADAEIVVAGMDRMLTYEKLRNATRFIRAGAAFVATNADRTFPTPQGLVPGAGSILAALEVASEVQPVVVGKPSTYLYREAMKRMGSDAQHTLVIGDRLETDIAGGQSLNCPTALVLSGVTEIMEAQAWSPEPEWISPDITHLLVGMRMRLNDA